MKRLLVDPLRTVATLVVGVVATVVAALAVMGLAWRNPRSPLIDRVARAWSWVWLAVGGVHLEVIGREHVDRSQSYVVVSNHLSNFDIMAHFAALPIPIRYLAKKELFRIPLLAPAMRAIGIVEVDRTAGVAIHEQVNRQARHNIEEGRSLIIYPEGTRTRTGELREFKKGAFTIAVTLGLPILPVSIHGTWEAWTPESKLIHGGHVKVIIHPAIDTSGFGLKDADRVRAEAKTTIAESYELLRSPR